MRNDNYTAKLLLYYLFLLFGVWVGQGERLVLKIWGSRFILIHKIAFPAN